jgi:hypothetical protein
VQTVARFLKIVQAVLPFAAAAYIEQMLCLAVVKY